MDQLNSGMEGHRKMIPLWRVQEGRIMSDGIRFEEFRKFRKKLRPVKKNSHSNQWSLKIFGKNENSEIHLVESGARFRPLGVEERLSA